MLLLFGMRTLVDTSFAIDTLRFNQLDTALLYDILQLRSEVFVVEQTCYYQDLDDKDRHLDARHMVFRDGAALAAYGRILPPGCAYPDCASLGRILTAQAYRRRQLGHAVVREGIAQCQTLWPEYSVKISAQSRLKRFYQEHGFYVSGEGYLEDGIPHLPMLRDPL